MPLPNLIQPVRVTVLPISKATTPYDPDAREPLRSARYGTALVIDAQPSFRQISRSKTAFEGMAADVSGYVLVRRKDLTTKSWTPTTGDRLSSIGSRSVEYYVTQSVDAAHWGDQNGSSLVRIYFASRSPETTAPTFS